MQLPLSCIRKLRSVLDLPYALSSSVDEKSSSFTFFTKKDLGMFRAQSWNPLPARYPLFIHRTIEELVLQGWKSNTWAGGKTRKLRCFSCARSVLHRRNATSALDSSRYASPSPSVRVRLDPNGSAPKMGSFKCEQVSGEAVVVVAVKAGGEREMCPLPSLLARCRFDVWALLISCWDLYARDQVGDGDGSA